MDEHLKSNADLHYEETTAPQNPPNSMVKQSARRGWLASSLGTVLLVFLVVGAVFGWVLMQRSLGSGPLHRSDPRPVGTSGTIAREPSPGGFNPTPRPHSTEDELDLRGAGDVIRSVSKLTGAPAGSRVRLANVRVDSTDATTGSFTIRDDDATATVAAPGGMPTVRAGQRVSVSGTIEAAGTTMRIRASRIDVR